MFECLVELFLRWGNSLKSQKTSYLFLCVPVSTSDVYLCQMGRVGKLCTRGSRLPPLGALEHLVPIPTPPWSGLHTVLCKWTGGRLTFSDPWGPWSETAWALQSLGGHLVETLPSPVHRCWNFLTEFFGSCVKERHPQRLSGDSLKAWSQDNPSYTGPYKQDPGFSMALLPSASPGVKDHDLWQLFGQTQVSILILPLGLVPLPVGVQVKFGAW